MTSPEIYMQRALELAELGQGRVSPNPMVGCVIVHEGKIIGEGWHRQFGGPHAEVNAIHAVADKSLLPESTVYVTLEPCSHFGKTPPCVDLLLEHRVKRVIICNQDTHLLVAGKGIEKLRAAGVDVTVGVESEKGLRLNKRFFHVIEKERPYIILKWAETADGFVAKENYDSKWISNEYARQLVHKWRAEEDGILVGRNTAAHDNPQLSVREWTGKNPVRIVIDRFLKLSDRLYIMDGTQPTIIYNVLKHEEHPNLTLMRIEEQGFLWHLLKDLHKRGIHSLFVEGGAHTLQSFINEGLWEEIRVFKSPKLFNKGIKAPHFHGNLLHTENVMGDRLFTYKRPDT